MKRAKRHHMAIFGLAMSAVLLVGCADNLLTAELHQAASDQGGSVWPPPWYPGDCTSPELDKTKKCAKDGDCAGSMFCDTNCNFCCKSAAPNPTKLFRIEVVDCRSLTCGDVAKMTGRWVTDQNCKFTSAATLDDNPDKDVGGAGPDFAPKDGKTDKNDIAVTRFCKCPIDVAACKPSAHTDKNEGCARAGNTNPQCIGMVCTGTAQLPKDGKCEEVSKGAGCGKVKPGMKRLHPNAVDSCDVCGPCGEDEVCDCTSCSET